MVIKPAIWKATWDGGSFCIPAGAWAEARLPSPADIQVESGESGHVTITPLMPLAPAMVVEDGSVLQVRPTSLALARFSLAAGTQLQLQVGQRKLDVILPPGSFAASARPSVLAVNAFNVSKPPPPSNWLPYLLPDRFLKGIIALAALLGLIYVAGLVYFVIMARVQLPDWKSVGEQWPVAAFLWSTGLVWRMLALVAGAAGTGLVLVWQLPAAQAYFYKFLAESVNSVGLNTRPGSVLGRATAIADDQNEIVARVFKDGARWVWDHGEELVLHLVSFLLVLFPCATYVYLAGINQPALLLAVVAGTYLLAPTMTDSKPIHFLGRVGLPLALFGLGTEIYDRSTSIPVSIAASDNRPAGAGVAMALSGGGYRAALLHAGVLSALEELRVPVTHLVTVSGGSIIGAFYAQGGNPADFGRAVAAGHFNIKRRVLWPSSLFKLLSPLGIPFTDVSLFPKNWGVSRTDIQRALISDTLLVKAGAFPRSPAPDKPHLLITTTDLWSGQAIGLSGIGVVRHRLPRTIDRLETSGIVASIDPVSFDAGLPKVGIAQAVAASGAFPFALTPVPYGDQYLLGDGGLFDNLGLTLLFDANYLAVVKKTPAMAAWKLGPVVVSDGSQIPSASTARSGGARALSAVPDILYASYSKAQRPPSTADPRPIFILSPSLFLPVEGEKRTVRQIVEQRISTLRSSSPVGPVADWLSRPAVSQRLAEAVIAFRDTSTLADQLEPERVASLQFLGRSLVMLQAREIALAAKEQANSAITSVVK